MAKIVETVYLGIKILIRAGMSWGGTVSGKVTLRKSAERERERD